MNLKFGMFNVVSKEIQTKLLHLNDNFLCRLFKFLDATSHKHGLLITKIYISKKKHIFYLLW